MLKGKRTLRDILTNMLMSTFVIAWMNLQDKIVFLRSIWLLIYALWIFSSSFSWFLVFDVDGFFGDVWNCW